jgi:thymidylate synthase ThyX
MTETAAAVVADSLADGVRLSTLVVTMPRFVLAEFNTHRAFSRNSSSSRAVPVSKLIELVETDPFVPEVFGAARPGMQAGEALSEEAQTGSRVAWLNAAYSAAAAARRMVSIGVHKQWANRVLEPFLWHMVVVSATDFDGFFAMRDHVDAQPEMRSVARVMRAALEASTPAEVEPGGWHLPWGLPIASAVARCARVSYLRHDAAPDEDADGNLAARLAESGHWSPFEHVARHGKPDSPGNGRNFKAPWVQFRSLMDGVR